MSIPCPASMRVHVARNTIIFPLYQQLIKITTTKNCNGWKWHFVTFTADIWQLKPSDLSFRLVGWSCWVLVQPLLSTPSSDCRCQVQFDAEATSQRYLANRLIGRAPNHQYKRTCRPSIVLWHFVSVCCDPARINKIISLSEPTSATAAQTRSINNARHGLATPLRHQCGRWIQASLPLQWGDKSFWIKTIRSLLQPEKGLFLSLITQCYYLAASGR